MKKLILTFFAFFAIPVLAVSNRQPATTNNPIAERVMMEFKGRKIRYSEIRNTIFFYSNIRDVTKTSIKELFRALQVGERMYLFHLIVGEEAKIKQFEKNPKYKDIYQEAYDNVSMAFAKAKGGKFDPLDPELQRHLEEAYNRTSMIIAIKEKGDKYSDAEIKKAYPEYAAKRKREEFEFKFILCSDRKTAESIINSLNSGASFEALAKQNSLHESKERGGLVPYASEDYLIREFGQSIVDELHSMVVNKNPTNPIMFINGYFGIVKLINSRTVCKSFEEAKKLMPYYLAEEEYLNMIDKKIKNGEIKFFNTNGTLKDPSEVLVVSTQKILNNVRFY